MTAMDDDFNSRRRLARSTTSRARSTEAEEGGLGGDRSGAQATPRAGRRARPDVRGAARADSGAKPFIELLVEVRRELRAAKQWALADKVRTRLSELGVAIEDRSEGTTWKTSRTR